MRTITNRSEARAGDIVLILDADLEAALRLGDVLGREGFRIAVDKRVDEAGAALENAQFDILLIAKDVASDHDLNPVSLLRRRFPRTPAIFVATSERFVVAAPGRGASGQEGPVSLRRIREALRAVSEGRRKLSSDVEGGRPCWS